MEKLFCPLCKNDKISIYYTDKKRDYYRCSKCLLIFVPPSQYITGAEEKERYKLHNNNPYDINYRNYLKQIFQPVNEQLQPNSYGLDFGCGPGPALSIMFEETGHKVENYDFYFAKNEQILNYKFDFITASEVLEHLHNPHEEIVKLWECLKPGGIFGIMTGLATDKQNFSDWYYIRDFTHVCFYSKSTFVYLSNALNAEISFVNRNTILLFKNNIL